MKKTINKILIGGLIAVISTGLIVLYNYREIKKNDLTYLNGVKSVDWSLRGLEQIKNDTLNNGESENEYYLEEIKLISAYMATKDNKYLEYTKKSADYITTKLSNVNLIADIKNDNDNVSTSVKSASILSGIAYLAKEDNNYVGLMNKLADGIIENFINKDNNLVWNKVITNTGVPIEDEKYGYESQFGNSSLKCAQALLVAYETNPEKDEYKDNAIKIINAVWERRNRETNLISESWDVLNDKVGTKMYPYSDFRYDDMGGVFIRTLMLAYNITSDKQMLDILTVYTPALVNGIWDTTINGGAFRYLNKVNGEVAGTSMVETMYGLFTATLLEASKIIDNEEVYNKCIEHANNIFINGFGVKNDMIPHAIDNKGNYLNENSDSQLGYAVIQFPLGYNMLSNITGDEIYREQSNKIVKTFLKRHKVKSSSGIADGYADIVETQEPYEFETSYSKVSWMSQIAYLPSYLLYNSIQTTTGVTIDWGYNMQPNVFGLSDDMPFWNIDNVNMDIKNKTLKLASVTGAGEIDLNAIGFGKIKEVLVDGEKYKDFKGNIIKTKDGNHKYTIKW